MAAKKIPTTKSSLDEKQAAVASLPSSPGGNDSSFESAMSSAGSPDCAEGSGQHTLASAAAEPESWAVDSCDGGGVVPELPHRRSRSPEGGKCSTRASAGWLTVAVAGSKDAQTWSAAGHGQRGRTGNRKDSVERGAQFKIPQGAVGLVLGKGGMHLQEIKKDSGAAIEVDQSTKWDGYSTVVIKGGRGVSAARKIIEAKLLEVGVRLDGGKIKTQEISIKQPFVAAFFGKGGEEVRALQMESGASIQVDQKSWKEGWSTVYIGGCPRFVDDATRMVNKRLAELGAIDSEPQGRPPLHKKGVGHYDTAKDVAAADDKEVQELKMDQSMVPSLIGNKGVNILLMEDRSGARLMFDQSTWDRGYSTLKISGTWEAVQLARKLVIEDMANVHGLGASAKGNTAPAARADDPRKGSARGAGAGGSGGTHGRARSTSAESRDGQEDLLVRVDQKHARHLVGPGGATVKAIEEQSGAKVKVTRTKEGFSTVRIKAGRGALKARELIAAKVKELEAMHAEEEVLELRFTSRFTSRIVGNGGRTIHRIEKQSGARVQVTKIGDPRVVTIRGDSKSVESARNLIHELLEEEQEASAECEALPSPAGLEDDEAHGSPPGFEDDEAPASPKDSAHLQSHDVEDAESDSWQSPEVLSRFQSVTCSSQSQMQADLEVSAGAASAKMLVSEGQAVAAAVGEVDSAAAAAEEEDDEDEPAAWLPTAAKSKKEPRATVGDTYDEGDGEAEAEGAAAVSPPVPGTPAWTPGAGRPPAQMPAASPEHHWNATPVHSPGAEDLEFSLSIGTISLLDRATSAGTIPILDRATSAVADQFGGGPDEAAGCSGVPAAPIFVEVTVDDAGQAWAVMMANPYDGAADETQNGWSAEGWGACGSGWSNQWGHSGAGGQGWRGFGKKPGSGTSWQGGRHAEGWHSRPRHQSRERSCPDDEQAAGAACGPRASSWARDGSAGGGCRVFPGGRSGVRPPLRGDRQAYRRGRSFSPGHYSLMDDGTTTETDGYDTSLEPRRLTRSQSRGPLKITPLLSGDSEAIAEDSGSASGDDPRPKLRVPQGLVGGLIGFKGMCINSMRQEYGVDIQLDQRTRCEGYSTFYFDGPADMVAAARDCMAANIATARRKEGPDSYQQKLFFRTLQVEVAKVGYIIGVGGLKIRNISEETNTRLDFNKHDVDGFCTLRISGGDEESVEYALNWVKKSLGVVDKRDQRGEGEGDRYQGTRRTWSPDGRNDFGAHGESTKHHSGGGNGGSFVMAVLRGLMGKWYMQKEGGPRIMFEVRTDLAETSSGSRLSCKMYVNGEFAHERAVSLQGKDIFLGERGRLFLDAITDKRVTWVEERKPEVKQHWARSLNLKPQAPSRRSMTLQQLHLKPAETNVDLMLDEEEEFPSLGSAAVPGRGGGGDAWEHRRRVGPRVRSRSRDLRTGVPLR